MTSHYDPTVPGQYSPPPERPTPRPQIPAWGKAVIVTCLLLIIAVAVGTSLTIDRAARAGDKAPAASTATPTLDPPVTPRQVEKAPDQAKQRTALYLSTVRNKYPEATAVSDEILVGLAEAACGVLDSGGDKADVVAALVVTSDDYMTRILAYAVGAGVPLFCPEHTTEIQS